VHALFAEYWHFCLIEVMQFVARSHLFNMKNAYYELLIFFLSYNKFCTTIVRIDVLMPKKKMKYQYYTMRINQINELKYLNITTL
jgi:hypothetical protein